MHEVLTHRDVCRLTLGDKSIAKEAVISLASGDPSQNGHIIKLPFTARVYKTLVQGGHYNVKEKKIDGEFTSNVTKDSG